jgi:Rod binding domain-containing protein
MADSLSSLTSLHTLTTAGIAPGVSSTKSKDSAAKIKDTAQQFEALMIGELLKTSREAGSGGGGWMGTGEEDQAGQAAVDMAEQQFATSMAKGGGIGLTNFITHSMKPKQ